jgi:hypothetical protein
MFEPRTVREDATPHQGSIVDLKEPGVISSQTRAARVVVRFKATTQVQYCITVNRNASGLCVFELVSADQVFFGCEFWDDSLTSLTKRRKDWSQLIKRCLNPAADLPSTPSASSLPDLSSALNDTPSKPMAT